MVIQAALQVLTEIPVKILLAKPFRQLANSFWVETIKVSLEFVHRSSSASGVCSLKNTPVSPGTTVSRAPPLAYAMTGLPEAWASTGTMPKSSSPGNIRALQQE